MDPVNRTREKKYSQNPDCRVFFMAVILDIREKVYLYGEELFH